MNMLQRYKKLLLLVILVWCGGNTGAALALTCNQTTGRIDILQSYINSLMDQQDVTITVGSTVPAGTVLHTQKIANPPHHLSTTDCLVNGSATISWTDFPAINQQTPLAGVDVKVHVMLHGAEVKETDQVTVHSVQEINDYLDGLSMFVDVVATGTPLSGGVLAYDFDAGGILLGLSPTPFGGVHWAQLWGNIPGGERLTLNMASCGTPPVNNYNMGDNSAKVFTKPGDATPWQATPVLLTGCAPFNGAVGGNSERKTYSSFTSGSPNDYDDALGNPGSGVILNVPRNKVSMTLTANTPIVDATQGIVTVTGTTPATGVGLQLGLKDGSGSYQPIPLNRPIEISPQFGDTTVKFDLGARYIQTGNSSVKGGDANATLTYTIDYQ